MLERIMKLANLLNKQAGHVKELEDQLKEEKSKLLKLEREDLPALMQEAGMTSVTLDDGSTISLKEDLNTSITASTKNSALRWLVDNNYGGIIKTLVEVAFPKGAHDDAVRVQNELLQHYSGVSLKETVHPSTLKSFVKERLEAGDAIPLDAFNVFPFTKAVVKGAKK